MIDIHSHILPAFDDGAQTLEDAIAMAQMAHRDGVRCIVATPHNLNWPPDYRKEQVEEGVARLGAELKAKDIPVEILPGVEVYMVPDIFQQMERGRAFTLNGSQYMLVELPLLFYPHYTEEIFFQLQIKGIEPILAHPERNAAIQNDPTILHGLVTRGILGQVTAASLIGVFGSKVRELARNFLEHNLVHIIASDAHTTHHRSPVLSGGVEEAAEIVGHERATAMVTTVPERILSGEQVEVEPPLEYKTRRRWFGSRIFGGAR